MRKDQKEYMKIWRKNNKEKLKLYFKEYRKKNVKKIRQRDAKIYQKNKEVVLIRNKEYRDNQKFQCIYHYSKGELNCNCCGESIHQFLTIDHINNDGNIHRKTLKRSGAATYRWLIKNNSPKGFQVLCFNCNLGKSINKGICPHQKRKMK